MCRTLVRSTAAVAVALIAAQSSWATDFFCPPEASSSMGFKQVVLKSIADKSQAVDESKYQEQTRHIATLSPAEEARIVAGAKCQGAVNDLSLVFSYDYQFKRDYNLTDVESFFVKYYLGDFVAAPAKSQHTISALLTSYREYASKCLQDRVPSDLNSQAVQRAVGVIYYDDGQAAPKAVCTGLRTGKGVRTARHCFNDLVTGRPLAATQKVAGGRARFWFTFEAEPDNRYEVCGSSLPTAGSYKRGSGDVVDLRVPAARAPAPELRWASAPLSPGTELYLRGYYALAETNGQPDINRLRATAHSGCVVGTSSDRCFMHGCQSAPVMSGAPIFVRTGLPGAPDTLFVAGIHLGDSGYAGASSAAQQICKGFNGKSVSAGNFGYQPPPP